MTSSAKKASLYLIPSPLYPGTVDLFENADIRDAVQKCRHFFVEDLKSARRYLRAVDASFPIDDSIFYPMDKRTDRNSLESAFYEIPGDAPVGVISEAGSPAIADPGNILVQLANASGRPVHPVTGPSSILLALMGSGMNGQHFTFHGYLPVKNAERQKKLKKLEERAKNQGATQIFMETPYRNNQMMKDALAVLDPSIGLCVACNIHGPEEFISSKPIKVWKREIPDLHKKPSVFLMNYY